MIDFDIELAKVGAQARIAHRDATGAAQLLQAAKYATATEVARQAAQDG